MWLVGEGEVSGLTPKVLASKTGKVGMLFIEIGNLSKRAVVSDFTILAFVKRRGKGRDHKSHCGHNEMPPGHLRRDVE